MSNGVDNKENLHILDSISNVFTFGKMLGVIEDGILVARGLLEGQSGIHKFGETDQLSANTVTDVWDYSGTEKRYTFSTAADIDSISSSNNTDTQVIRVDGLDTNWGIVSQTVSLSGTARVALGTSLIRVYRVENEGSTDIAGHVYVYPNTAITNGVPDDTSKVRAFVNNGNNQTLMAIMPVPANKKAYLNKWSCELSGKTSGNTLVRVYYRPFGGVFKLKESISLMGAGNSAFQYEYICPLEFNAKGDFIVRVNPDTVNMQVSAAFDLKFIDDA